MKAPLAVAFFALAAHAPFAGAQTAEQKAWLAKAARADRAGWIALHVEGTPQERGFQHGYLLAKEIGEALRVRREVWRHQTAMEWPWLLDRVKAVFAPKVDPENLAEMEGIAAGMKAAGVAATRDDIVAYNAWFDIFYWWPKEKDKLGAKAPDAPHEGCSSFIATGSATADGKVVLAHNTWFGYTIADANVILDLKPAKGHRILMQVFPGWVHSGTDFFVTDAGLVGSETTIGDFTGFDEKGVPEFARMRRATQDAASIDEWCAIMKKGNNGGYANAWLLGDVNTNEIARLELGLKHVAFERKKDGWFVGSNIAEDLKILRFETTSNDTDIRDVSIARRVRWKQLMKDSAGKIDVAKAKGFLGDGFDTYLGKEGPDSRSLCGRGDLDARLEGGGTPFSPSGAFDAKVVDSAMAKRMTIAAHWGAACGPAFDAAAFLAAHPQFEWMAGLLKDRPRGPWTEFTAGETERR
jgi:Phospholipase B